MEIHVVRHGETDYNAHGRYAGSTDVPLNEIGRLQAAQLAEKIAATPYHRIVSSPLRRARETAEILQRKPPIPLTFLDDLSERNLGVYEGLTRGEAMARYPELWNRQCTRHLDDAPTGGETIRRVIERVSDALDTLKTAYPEERILLVCHGFISRVINHLCLALPYDEMHGFSLGNCEVVEYRL